MDDEIQRKILYSQELGKWSRSSDGKVIPDQQRKLSNSIEELLDKIWLAQNNLSDSNDNLKVLDGDKFIQEIQSLPNFYDQEHEQTPESNITTDDLLHYDSSPVKVTYDADTEEDYTGTENVAKACEEFVLSEQEKSKADDQISVTNSSIADSNAFDSEESYDSRCDSLYFQNKVNDDVGNWSNPITTDSRSDWDSEEDSSGYDVYPCPDYDQSFGNRFSQLKYKGNIIRKKDSSSLAKMELNTTEIEKYENIWQKIDKIHYDLDRSCEKDEDYYKRCEKEFDEVIGQALKQGIMFTFPYKGGLSIVDRIIDTLNKLYLSYDTTRIYEFIEKTKISHIISQGAYLNELTKEEHEDYVNIICADKDILDERYKNISKLNNVAYESIINSNKQKSDFKVEIDNGYFFIKYEKGNVVELTKVINNKIIDDLNSEYKLNLKIGILQIGKSIVRVEKLGERRNYTDVPQGIIKMSFTTEVEGKVEKISILLYPNEDDNRKIQVELDEENQEKFSKLKDKSSLGKNCLLGGKNVLQAIQDKEFTKYESYKPATLPTLLEQCSTSNVFSSLKDKYTQFPKYVFGG